VISWFQFLLSHIQLVPLHLGVIPNSFCIVRNPFERLLSEFRYWSLMSWVEDPPEDSCAAFEGWVDGVASNIIGGAVQVECS
jgi:hypothetical protein